MKVRLDTYETVAEPDGVLYNDLTIGNVYRIIGIEADSYRIMSDAGLPLLYPPELFTVIDPSEPEDWITTYGEGSERYAYPEALSAPGLFDDYFDYNKEAMRSLRLHRNALRQTGSPQILS